MSVYNLKTDPVSQSLHKLPALLRKDVQRNLCVCNEVVMRDVIAAIVNGASSVAEIKKQTYATTGSGCCTQQIERLLEYLGATETET